MQSTLALAAGDRRARAAREAAMHPKRLPFAFLLVGALPALACAGGATQPPVAPSASHVASSPAVPSTQDRLFVRVAAPAGRIDVLDAVSGAVVRELPDGVLSSDGATLYTVDTPASGQQSVVRAIAADSGALLGQQ